jgi:hypothetical protein
MTPADRRRLRWFARCFIAAESAPDAYRLSVLEIARTIAAGNRADALLDTLDRLLLETLDAKPKESA